MVAGRDASGAERGERSRIAPRLSPVCIVFKVGPEHVRDEPRPPPEFPLECLNATSRVAADQLTPRGRRVQIAGCGSRRESPDRCRRIGVPVDLLQLRVVVGVRVFIARRTIRISRFVSSERGNSEAKWT